MILNQHLESQAQIHFLSLLILSVTSSSLEPREGPGIVQKIRTGEKGGN